MKRFILRTLIASWIWGSGFAAGGVVAMTNLPLDEQSIFGLIITSAIGGIIAYALLLIFKLD